MKSLQEIKDEYAREKEYKSWGTLMKDFSFHAYRLENCMIEIAKRYALEVAKETQRRCSDAASRHQASIRMPDPIQIGTILSETNIPELI